MSNNYKKGTKSNEKKRGSRIRNNRKGPDRGDPIEKTGLDNRGRDNDPNDYFYSEELANQATQLSFQNMLGLGSFNAFEIPTICRVDLNPSPGISYSLESASLYAAWKEDPSAITPEPTIGHERAGLNMMCMKLYTLLATFSGRTSNYGPQDVGVMILAIASIAEYSEHLRRMFGVALTYNARNRTMPMELLESMGVDPAFCKSISDYRMRFNVQMSRINQIPLLDNVGFIRKSRNLYQKVYQDDPSSMAQIFYFAPSSTWTINETSYSGGTVLEYDHLFSSLSTMDSLLDRLDNMITKILESSTLNLIYADLLNLANKLKVPTWQFDYLAENYVVMPEYNETASLQFHNLNVVGSPDLIGSSIATGVVTPSGWSVPFTRGNNVYTDASTNSIVYNPVFSSLFKSRPNSIVDMLNDNPTVVDRIEALRMSTVPSGWYLDATQLGGSSGVHYGIFPTLSDHYVVQLKIFKNRANSGSHIIGKYAYRKDVDSESNFMKISSLLSKFRRSPIIEYYDLYANGMNTIAMTGDVDFYTEINYQYLKKVNQMMFVGLFDFRV